MSTNGETADMVVRESIQITESAVKLAGLGAKNLAALLVAVAKDDPKLSGKTGLKRLIQDGEELAIFSVKQEDLQGFQLKIRVLVNGRIRAARSPVHRNCSAAADRISQATNISASYTCVPVNVHDDIFRCLIA